MAVVNVDDLFVAAVGFLFQVLQEQAHQKQISKQLHLAFQQSLEDGRKCNFGVNLNQESFNKEIETVILNLTKNEGLRQYIEKKMDEKVDVSRLENELDQTKENIKQSRAAKDRLLDYMEQLDQNDRHYNKKGRYAGEIGCVI